MFDIETDGLLDTVSKVHCIVLHNPEEPQVYHRHYGSGIQMALWELEQADTIVAHNQISYDLPVLEKLYPSFQRPPLNRIIDTLVLSRLYNPDLKGHSLEAWAKRLIKKGLKVPEKHFIADWSNQSLEDYLVRCETDVMINAELWKGLSRYVEPENLGRSELWERIT